MLLAGVEGACKGATVPLRPPSLTIGKRPGNDLVLGDEFVSRVHARIEVRDDSAVLVDEGSTNGSFVNEVQVRTAPLQEGDRLRFGNCVFEYRARPSAVLLGEAEDTALRGTRLQMAPLQPTAEHVTAQRPAPAFASASRALAALAELGRGLRLQGSLPEILDRILDAAFGAVAVDRGAVVLVDEEGGLHPQSVRYGEGPQSNDDMPVSTTLARRALAENSAILVPDARIDPELSSRASIVTHGIRCAAYVPLLAQGRPVGLLCVDTAKPGALGDHHLQILSALAEEAGAVVEIARLRETIQQQTRLRLTLERYMASQVVAEILASGGEVDLSGREQQITVLFADLRGFTSLAEQLPAREAVGLLNTVLESLTRVVFKHHGTLDKYIGDGLMALFGAPFADPQQILRACLAAVDMHQMLCEASCAWAEKYGQPTIGVAIHTGKAVVGNVGTSERVQYTAIGDTVNITSRLEEIAGPGETLVSQDVAAAIDKFFELEPLGTKVLRGRMGAVTVHRLLCPKNNARPEEIA